MKRRHFLRLAAPLALSPALLANCAGTNPGAGPTNPAPAPAPLTDPNRKLGIAILGLGNYAKTQIAPALQLTNHCELRGLITGSPQKLPQWQKQYGVSDANCYTYNTMAELANNPDIDVVYVITPTATHREFAVAAANTGKHVWCEKPMAMTPGDCQAIIDACQSNNVRLAIGYRMLHEPNTRKLIHLTRHEAYGPLSSAQAYAGYQGKPPPADYWRGQQDMGGGALYDMGIYCVNGLRYATQMEPVAVERATQSVLKRMNGPDLTTVFTLRYANGMTAEGKTSIVEKYNLLRVEAERGWYQLSPMQTYTGVEGATSDGHALSPRVPNQQSIQMDDDARAILTGLPLTATGEMGKADVAVIRAIRECAETGKEVAVGT